MRAVTLLRREDQVPAVRLAQKQQASHTSACTTHSFVKRVITTQLKREESTWHINKLLLERCTERFLIDPELCSLKTHRLQVTLATFKIALEFNSLSACNQLPTKCGQFKTSLQQLIRFCVTRVLFPCPVTAGDSTTQNQWWL